MPYVSEEKRDNLDYHISNLVASIKKEEKLSGSINYSITRILLEALKDPISYDQYNSMIGVLECAKLELYRRRVAEYENLAKAKNGEVY